MTVPMTYMTTTKNLDRIFDSMRQAAVPQRFSYDFLKQLGFLSSGDRPIIPLLKALGFLDASGTPTDRYERFRDENQSGPVMAEAVREAYSDVFAMNESAHTLKAAELRGIFARLTGKQAGVVEKMATTFRALVGRADFSATPGHMASESPRRAADAHPTGPADLGTDVHPLILGLIRELPPAGNAFPAERQRDWLDIAQSTFRLIYGAETDQVAPDTGESKVGASESDRAYDAS